MMKVFTHKWTHILVLLALLAGAVYFSGSEHELRKRLQYATFDTYNKLKPRPASDRVVIIDLTRNPSRNWANGHGHAA